MLDVSQETVIARLEAREELAGARVEGEGAMTADRQRRVSELYHAVREREAGDREAYLAAACAEDADLRREVESLLACDDEAAPFLESPALDVAAELVDVPSASAVPLIGRQIGTFQIVALIGAGGMGTVYRAHDMRLGRDVALKILPADFTADPARRARFEREARVLATLNHPHIAAIYGVADAEDLSALVLELVEGGTLADWLATGPLAAPQALTLARQIAEALAAAHDKGIVHRDLKPANVGLTADGAVKVLDFGLAKAIAGEAPGADDAQTCNLTAGLTRDGMMLGTPAYMSPEQTRGDPVGTPSDIWAFGCLLYEMLTGGPPFEGVTVTDTFATIVTREPDWTKLPTSLPASVQNLIERCLDKDPRRRLSAIADAATAIDGAHPPSLHTGEASDRPRGRSAWLVPALAGLALIGAVGLVVLGLRRPDAGPQAVPVTMTSLPGIEDQPSFSPDGTEVAFQWNGPKEDNFDIYTKPVGQGDPVRLTTDPAGDTSPAWSPDGRWIAFSRQNPSYPKSGPMLYVYVIPARSGPEQRIGPGNVTGWTQDSRWLVVSRGAASGRQAGVVLVSPETREEKQLTQQTPSHLDTGVSSPDARALAVRRILGATGVSALLVLGLERVWSPWAARGSCP